MYSSGGKWPIWSGGVVTTASTSTHTKQGGESGEGTSQYFWDERLQVLLLWMSHYPTGEEDPAVAGASQEPAEVRDANKNPALTAASWRAP